MKKLFLFLFSALLFTACSNDDADNIEVKPEGKTYKVTFNVENFEIVESNLKSGDSIKDSGPYYVIFDKETGAGIVGGKYSDTITVELEAGNYIFAGINTNRRYAPGTSYGPTAVKDMNFYTAKELGSYNSMASRDNSYAYYGKLEFSVGENIDNKEIKKVVLDPMWSELVIDITDYDSFSTPDETTHLISLVDPYYHGFYFKDGTPAFQDTDFAHDYAKSKVSIDGIRDGSKKVRKIVSETKDITVKIIFYKQVVYGSFIVGEKIIYKGDLPRGKRITLRGALGSSSNGKASFTPVLGDLTDGGVIPFNQ